MKCCPLDMTWPLDHEHIVTGASCTSPAHIRRDLQQEVLCLGRGYQQGKRG